MSRTPIAWPQAGQVTVSTVTSAMSAAPSVAERAPCGLGLRRCAPVPGDRLAGAGFRFGVRGREGRLGSAGLVGALARAGTGDWGLGTGGKFGVGDFREKGDVTN